MLRRLFRRNKYSYTQNKNKNTRKHRARVDWYFWLLSYWVSVFRSELHELMPHVQVHCPWYLPKCELSILQTVRSCCVLTVQQQQQQTVELDRIHQAIDALNDYFFHWNCVQMVLLRWRNSMIGNNTICTKCSPFLRVLDVWMCGMCMKNK